MSSDELERALAALKQQRMFFSDSVFVLTLERTEDGFKVLEYGVKDIGDLAAWLAVQNEKHTKGEQA
ncbi:MAG: hypothetical protein HRF47_13880 [Chloroflexota bacterium]